MISIKFLPASDKSAWFDIYVPTHELVIGRLHFDLVNGVWVFKSNPKLIDVGFVMQHTFEEFEDARDNLDRIISQNIVSAFLNIMNEI